MTTDIQAGRALTLIAILAGLLGFIVALLGGGVANCSGAPPDPLESPTTSSSRKKVLRLYSYRVDCALVVHITRQFGNSSNDHKLITTQ